MCNCKTLCILFVPIDEIIAVTQVPIFWPIIGNCRRISVSAADSVCNIPTDADELWIIPVTKAPVKMPIIGFENRVKMLVNSGTFASGWTALDIVSFQTSILQIQA